MNQDLEHLKMRESVKTLFGGGGTATIEPSDTAA